MTLYLRVLTTSEKCPPQNNIIINIKNKVKISIEQNAFSTH